MSISAGGDSSRCPRLVMRVEHVGRLILNESLLPTTAPVAKVRVLLNFSGIIAHVSALFSNSFQLYF